LFSSSLSPELNVSEESGEKVGKKTTRQRAKPLTCSGKVEAFTVSKHNSARYILDAYLLENDVKINFQAVYFILFQNDEAEEENEFKDVCLALGKHVIWPKFRDLSAIVFAQSGWQTAQLQQKACEFAVTEVNLGEHSVG